MAAKVKTYSFKDLSGGFSHPFVGSFLFAGQIGMNQVTIAMATDKTVHDLAADGTVMPSYIPGDNGSLAIEVQQTSRLHAFLLGWYNLIKIAADAGDVSNWATAAVTVRSLVDGSQHQISGISPSRIPDKVYAQQGQKLTWNLMAADVQNITLGF
jgi:hypothetical protein